MKHALKDSGETSVQRSLTIGRPVMELYEFWRDPYSLAEIANDMIQITPLDAETAQWKLAGALGTGLEWTARLTDGTPGQMVHWRAEDAKLTHDLQIAFKPAPADQGTETTITFRYDVPGGIVGDAVVKLFGIAPDLLVHKLLRRFKALVETGEMPTLEYNVSNRKQASQPGEQR